MRPRFPLFVFAALFAVSSSSFAESAAKLMTDGQRSYISGDITTAKAKFGQVLAMDPQNKPAANYLRMIKAAEEKGGGGGSLQKKLNGLVLPRVNLKDTTFGTALDYLKQQAAKEGTPVSFVTQLPADFLNTKTVTLALDNVPFTEALRYVGELAGVTFTIEQYAISVRPLEAKAAEQPQ